MLAFSDAARRSAESGGDARVAVDLLVYSSIIWLLMDFVLTFVAWGATCAFYLRVRTPAGPDGAAGASLRPPLAYTSYDAT